MSRHHNAQFRWAAAVIAAAGLLLAGCGDDTPNTGPSASPASSTVSTSPASPSATSTLTAAQEQAVTEATEAVRAYEQTYTDILADPTPTLDDMNKVATQPQLERDLRSLQRLLTDDTEVIYESTGPIVVESVDPVKVDLESDPNTVVLEACVDSTAVRGTENGTPQTGPRQLLSYRVVRTTYLPAPGWAVSRVHSPRGHDDFPSC